MGKVEWTNDQKKVIELRNRNILVSAAAGSGKTAVLVERIITMITEGLEPIDIDKLLVVTFTNAAASEMKQRISLGIEEKLRQFPDNVHLQKQMTLIHSAQITTIHSFCLNVIRNNFNSIDLDPSFRIGDDAELKLLKSDVIGQILERHYEAANEEFLDFIEAYSVGKSDYFIEELILQLHGFSMSYPWPLEWLEEKREIFSIQSLEEMEKTDWINSLLEYMRNVLKDVSKRNEEALRITKELNGPIAYIDALLSDQEIIDNLLTCKTYKEYESGFELIKFARLSSKKVEDVDPEKKEQVKLIRDEIKKSLADISKGYFYQSAKEMLGDIIAVKDVMNVLINLTCEFTKEYANSKQEKNLVDFNDLEHFALNILVKKENEIINPSSVALDLSEYYEEILIDEYQDSNFVQETILSSISKERIGRPNLFMVGDVKQSIYKFRLARPELFMDKFDRYSLEDSSYQRIDLHKNFRSRHVVLDSANYIFEQIMTKNLGNIEYNKEAALYVGSKFEDSDKRISTSTEILLIPIDEDKLKDGSQEAVEFIENNPTNELEDKDEEEYTAKELEARVIASKIKELTHENHGLMIWDKNSNSYKITKNKDIVILLRTMSGWSDVFVDTLMAEGIAAYSDTQSGYFSALEVKTVLNMLRIVDNPRQDIPLTAVLRSPIVGLTTNELSIIRSHHKKAEMFDTIVEYSISGEDHLIKEKVKQFLEQLSDFRNMVAYTNVHNIILTILDVTGYYDFVSAMPAGNRRSGNINMLIQKAIQYEATSYKGLFNFIRYIEKLHKYDIDFGEVGILGENDNTVRIMSIHKSKGLEFPVVFVAGMGKNFNNQDSRSKLVIHPDLGIGPDFIDHKLRVKAPTLIKKVIQKKLVIENLAEELRVLYVGLTRAKEKLIITGTIKKFEEKLKKHSSIKNQNSRHILFQKLSTANTYFDWIIPAIIRNQLFSEVLNKYEITVNSENPLYKESVPIEIKVVDISNLAFDEIMKQLNQEVGKEELLMWDTNKIYDQEVRCNIEKILNCEYKYKNELEIHAKVTVTELKKMEQTIDEGGAEEYIVEQIDEIVPKFISQSKDPTPSFRGTIYHKVLECIDILSLRTKEDIDLELKRLVIQKKINEEDLTIININELYTFIGSDLANRMRVAKELGKLYTEKQFVLGLYAKDVNPLLESEEIVLVQGIIDVFFEEDDQLVLMDYKTDKIKPGREQVLINRYKVQLEYYEKALSQILGKTIKEKIIYSFALGKEIKV